MIYDLVNVRASFPHLFKPRPIKSKPDSTPRYSIQCILDEDQYGAFATWCVEELIPEFEPWSEYDPEEHFDKLVNRELTCLHDGDEMSQYEGYEGHWYVSCNRNEDKGPPLIYDADGVTELTRQSRTQVSPGNIVTVVADVWCQDKSAGWGKDRINCELQAVVFVEDDGVSWGGNRRVSKEHIKAIAPGRKARRKKSKRGNMWDE